MATQLTHHPDREARFLSMPGSGARIALVVLAGVALALAAAGRDRIGTVAMGLFEAYVSAQQKMIEASGNLTADGRAEFAVLLAPGASPRALREALSGIDDVTFEREADLGGWVVISTAAGNREGLDAVQALPQARLVVPNRGLWICH